MDAILNSTVHRPWPLPRGPWALVQTWRDVLFAHWPVAVAQLRALVPTTLPIDTFDGSAWVAVTPLYIDPLRVRWLPPLPGSAAFAEINVRTYVTVQDKPGVFFFSLDAASLLAVMGARATYLLPYFHARMARRVAGDGVVLQSERRAGARARFAAEYGPAGEVHAAQRGTLEHFLTERYCLYTARHGSLYRAEVHHLPWPLQEGRAEIRRNSLALAAGIELPDSAPLLHFARELKVYVWPLRRVPAPAYVHEAAQVAMKPI